jgi:hypothetical protein
MTSTSKPFARLGVLASLALLAPATQAADTTPEPPPPPRYSAPAAAPLAASLS